MSEYLLFLLNSFSEDSSSEDSSSEEYGYTLTKVRIQLDTIISKHETFEMCKLKHFLEGTLKMYTKK
jgi:hypothetical protein